MNIGKHHSSDDVNTNGGGLSPPCAGIAAGTLPEVLKPITAKELQTGASTRNALPGSNNFAGKRRLDKFRHWYALRTTYGREKKAYNYLIGKNVVAFYPTLTTVKLVDGKRKIVEKSRIPNIFFAYGTEDEIKSYVYDNINLPYLRFYYRHHHMGGKIVKEPLTVPNHQIETLRIICDAKDDNIILTPTDIQKFRTGQLVHVVDGCFKGVTGIVARYKGQQRVGIIINGLLTTATAYVPTAFIREIDKD